MAPVGNKEPYSTVHIKHLDAFEEDEKCAVLLDYLGVGRRDSWALGSIIGTTGTVGGQIHNAATTCHASK